MQINWESGERKPMEPTEEDHLEEEGRPEGGGEAPSLEWSRVVIFQPCTTAITTDTIVCTTALHARVC